MTYNKKCIEGNNLSNIYSCNTNIKFYCIYQYSMSIDSFFNTVYVHLTVKFTNKIHTPLFSPFFLVYINDQQYSRFYIYKLLT